MMQEKTSRITGLKGKDRILFFVLALVTALVPMLYLYHVNHGQYYIADDYITQQVPFTMMFGKLIRSGAGLDTWNWDMDLGSSTLQSLSFYCLGSPFFWLTVPLKQDQVMNGLGVIMVLKYITACYTAQFYLKRFVKDPRQAVPGAFLYAFSGFQAMNIVFNHFHDVIAVFPLLLAGLEILMADDSGSHRRTGLFFAFTVFLNGVVNYFFFVQSVILLVIYWVFRFGIFRNPKRILKDLGRILPYAFLGAGLAAFLLVPNYLYILSNPRTGVDSSLNLRFYSLPEFFYMLKGYLLPGDAMLDETAFLQMQWDSTSCYLPFLGYAFVYAYMLKKRDWLTALLALLMVLSFLPAGNSFFILFTEDYQRWWYGIVMLGALASVKVLEDAPEYPLAGGALVQLALFSIMTAYGFAVKDEYGNPALLFHKLHYIVMLASTLPVLILSAVQNRKPFSRSLKFVTLAGICLYGAGDTVFTEHAYQGVYPEFTSYYADVVAIGEQLPSVEPQYRYRNYSNVLTMCSLEENTSGIRSYSSTMAMDLKKLDLLFEYTWVDHSTEKNKFAGLSELLGGRYRLVTNTQTDLNRSSDAWPKAMAESGSEVMAYDAAGHHVRILDYEACPIGYRVTRYITPEEMEKIPLEKRGLALLYAAVHEKGETMADMSMVTADDILKVIGTKYDEDLHRHPMIHELVQKNSAGAVKNFTRNIYGFACETVYAEDSLVFFSIPADQGWTITIDGKETSYTDNTGLLLVPVPAGEHEVNAVWHTPGYKEGKIITVICLVIFCILTLKGMKHTNTVNL